MKKLTEDQVIGILRTHRTGPWTVDDDGAIRLLCSGGILCPLETIAKDKYGEILLYYKPEVRALFSKPIFSRILDAADIPLSHLNTEAKKRLRRRILRAVGLKEPK